MTPAENSPLVSMKPAVLVGKFTFVVVDTGGKFATPVADTGEKFATGVTDTGAAP
jgi:hypothetical protein